MCKIAVVSTTHIDRHNTRITKEALERAAYRINNGKKPVITVEHDTTLPPIGQIVRAWVELPRMENINLSLNKIILRKKDL